MPVQLLVAFQAGASLVDSCGAAVFSGTAALLGMAMAHHGHAWSSTVQESVQGCFQVPACGTAIHQLHKVRSTARTLWRMTDPHCGDGISTCMLQRSWS